MYKFIFLTIKNNLNTTGFQSPATPVMEGIIDLHDYIFFYLVLIFIFVIWTLAYVLYNFYFIPAYLHDFLKAEKPFLNLHFMSLLGACEFFLGKKFFKKLVNKPNGFFAYGRFTIYDYQHYILSGKYKQYKFMTGHFFWFFMEKALYRHQEIITTRLINHGPELEFIWTLIPSCILLFIAIPSFSLLYALDEILNPQLTIKIIGYQWFWSYEYNRNHKYLDFEYLNSFELYIKKNDLENTPIVQFLYENDPKLNNDVRYINDFNIYVRENDLEDAFITKFLRENDPKLNIDVKDSIVFDSILIPEELLEKHARRLLEVDHQLILPSKTHIRLLITAGDVLHSWAVPSFGVKIDAVPGRLSQVPIFIKREGVFYGQCSELCGLQHGFMPIVVKTIDQTLYYKIFYNNIPNITH